MNYYVFSKNRNELFGAAIVLILFFHFAESVVARPETVSTFTYSFAKLYNILISSIGVDMFLFLSGMGLSYSIKKDRSIISFYKKRFQRIIVPYLIVGLPFWVLKDLLLTNETLCKWILDISLISFWVDGTRSLWYISFITLVYLFYPLIVKLNEKIRNGIAIYLEFICYITFTIILAVLFPDYILCIEIALGRVMSFFLGCIFWGRINEKVAVSKKDISFLILSITILILFGDVIRNETMKLVFSRWWHAIYSVLIMLLLCKLFEKDYRHPNREFCWLGQYTLEIYLVHVTIRNIFNTIGYYTSYWYYYLPVVIIAILIAPFISNISKRVRI